MALYVRSHAAWTENTVRTLSIAFELEPTALWRQRLDEHGSR